MLLSAIDVIAGYQPDLPILHGVSVDVAKGEIVAILGPNGAGKSTLIKAIAGLLPLTGGRITLAGQSIGGLPAHRLLHAGVSYVPQIGNVFTTLTVHENLRVAAHTLSGRYADRLERMYALFPDLAAKRRQPGRQLSGGQRQMLAFAKALVTEPSVLMLDEPSAGLAPKAAETIFEKVRELAQGGVAVLLVEQNVKSALRFSDRAFVLAEGRNRLAGTADSLRADPAVADIYLGKR
ncbi:MAG: ABC transporter ATP-binding protein [Alphaproteobacteria bacterium]|nr:ABC transporter ATP-binding protein [Alphaproteobacteria bacterium]